VEKMTTHITGKAGRLPELRADGTAKLRAIEEIEALLGLVERVDLSPRTPAVNLVQSVFARVLNYDADRIRAVGD